MHGWLSETQATPDVGKFIINGVSEKQHLGYKAHFFCAVHCLYKYFIKLYYPAVRGDLVANSPINSY